MSTLSPKKQAALIAAFAVLAAAAAWFLLVSPKRSEAAQLATQVEQTADELTATRIAIRKTKEDASVAPLPRLKRAMPDDADMAAVMRELNALGARSGVEFASITPSPVAQAEGYRVVPLSVDFEGDFPRVTRLLRIMREQVAVRKGVLSANGRLFSVESLRLTSDDQEPGKLSANLTLDIFLYGPGGGAPATDAAAATEATG